jgi:cell division GTPase FtsZ
MSKLNLDKAYTTEYNHISEDYLSLPLPNFKENTRALIIGLGGSANNVLVSLKENCNIFYRSMNVGAYDMNPVGNTFYCIPDRWPYFYQMLSFPEHFEEDLQSFIHEEISRSEIDVVFVVSGLGNHGTGTLLTKTVLSLVKELGFPCISVVSLPFLFQGNKALASSLETFREIQKVAGLMICFPLEEIVKDNKGYTVLDAFKIADLWMSGTIQSIITGSKELTTRAILSKIIESY